MSDKLLNPTEHDAQVAFFDWCASMSNQDSRYKNIYAIPNQGKRSPGATNYMYREGLRPGYPDINVDIPIYFKDGRTKRHGLRIEHKRKGGKLTTKQREELARIGNQVEPDGETASWDVAVCYGTDDLVFRVLYYLGQCEKCNGPKRLA